MAGDEGEGTSLEFTPTWVVAAVCTVIVGVSLAVERLLHHVGKKLQKEGKKPLFEALQKNHQDLCEREYYGTLSSLLVKQQGPIVIIRGAASSTHLYFHTSYRAPNLFCSHRCIWRHEG
ncbi:hypothetical protein Ccrd_003765 [Cynara cardunculus var. scolymus]|uniref:Uncharacterized protein n=1 Tax=Cynara cardunculus var. scolymus TaxID=59895 RepID=A0A103XNU3_CYNCS|nr:hypothetical protein Ccrd_003765 [Cynara cardunculus var. scolymus]